MTILFIHLTYFLEFAVAMRGEEFPVNISVTFLAHVSIKPRKIKVWTQGTSKVKAKEGELTSDFDL